MFFGQFSFRATLCGVLISSGALSAARAVIRDGGIDPANLGKGDWIYFTSMATNKLGGNVASVTNEHSLMRWYTNQGVRYVIVKAATDDFLFNGSYNFPQFTSNLVNIAHAHGLLIFGYNRSYGANVPGEIQIANYVFNQGADGFVWDAESEWESGNSWITNGPAQAWTLCSTVRSNWPNKFLAHAPFDIISFHSSFPYKEFGYWCDAVMPQIYHFARTSIKSRPSGNINWADANWKNWQNALAGQSTNMGGQTIFWTNAIKPLAPVNHVYGPNPPNSGVSEIPPSHVMEFVDCLSTDPNTVTAGGYKGASFWRADLHGAAQWTNIKAATIGDFPGIVNNLVIDSPNATRVGAWTSVRTFSNGAFFGNGTGTDTNSFGSNYLTKFQGPGSDYIQFTPNVVAPGDYDVYQWHATVTNASASVPHVITFNGGTATVFANQLTNPGTWSLLGRFNFAAGTAGNIRVSDNIPEAGAVAIADGIKLVFVSATIPVTPPAIVTPPQDQAVLVGQGATFSVTATGSPPLQYQWRFGGQPISGATNSDFTLAPTLATNSGLYSVTVSNAAGGAVSSNALLLVQFAGAWGDNTFGQLNLPELTTALAVAAGEWHSLALFANGHVAAWGDNWNGQCNVPASLSNAMAIAGGGYHSLAIRTDGTVAAWGANDYNQSTVPAGLKNVFAIAAGSWHSLALKTDGTVVAWGDNAWGQVNSPAGLTNVAAIAAGGNHCLVLKSNGTVIAWGQNIDANGFLAGQSTVPPGLSNVIGIAAGAYHSVALWSDRSVIAWGDNSQNQSTPPGSLSNVVAVVAGGFHNLALRTDGSLTPWGASIDGQAGFPPGISNVIALAAGYAHTILVLDSGALPAPRWLGLSLNAGKFGGFVPSFQRKSYVLEFKNSLADPNWTTITTATGNGALLRLADPVATGPARYYRVRFNP
ncbi:MAG: hypothetical protein EXS35_18175 [Pedosphaera sp.]|nr:hypothetical protein [Pedosphaera sp.]